MHRYFLVIASLLFFLFDCAAQADSMLSVAGKVKDPAGEAVSNAQVVLLNSQQTVLGERNTDGKGAFSFENVVPGSYLVVVRSGAFKEVQRPVVVANESVQLEITLELDVIREAVTVTAQLGRVEEKNKVPQQVNVISGEQILERATTVVAQIAQEEVGLSLQRTSPTMSAIFIRGLTGTKVNAFVDGVRYTTSAQRGGVNTFFNMIEPSFLQGAEILRGPNSAQYGSDALGGSVQFLSRNPFLSVEKGWGSRATAFYNDADHGYGANFGTTYKKDNFAFLVDVAGRQANTTRPGEGIDSHNAVTRFFDISSDFAIDGRLPETEFTQYGGMVKTVWSPSTGSFVTANYIRTQTDDGKRYDQLIGGDGNLIADLRDFSLDLFYLKYEKLALGWFDGLTATYSFNSQHEERVNQGGNGNPRANINFEPERTNANGIQAQLNKQLSTRQSLLFGAEFYHERIDAPSESLNPTTDIFAIRRGRVPDNARYNSWGIYAQDVIDMIPEKLSFTGNVRYSGVSYKSRASDAPVSSSGEPLWPDDSFDTGYGSFRAGIIYSPHKQWSLMANFSTGFRAPNITDLGTLGLTGSGFEVDAAEVAGLGATIGSTAGSSAVSTGLPVTQLTSETSLNYEFGTRFSNERFETEIVFFLTDIGDNIAKQALILPQGAVGLTLGDEVITSQNANGVVFVSASPSPVLVRANFDDARIYGIEYELEAQLARQWSMEGGFTYIHAEDKRSGLPPNIEGGTPAPNGYLKVRYSALNKPFWIEPYILGATKQDRLSSLDLEDRRTGAGRSVSSITNFFRNGATVRGFIGPGADGVLGNSDDVLIATGETLNEVLLRVLGPGLQTSSLFTELPAYLLVNVRFGFQFGGNELLVDFQNITDKNFRGISWGMDGPGRGIYIRYLTRF